MSTARKPAFQDDTVYVRRSEPAEAGALAEFSVVALRRPARTIDGIVVPSGAIGAIVRVWDGGTSYEVEFLEPQGALATVAHEDLVKVGAGG